jgi:hypothetical protein
MVQQSITHVQTRPNMPNNTCQKRHSWSLSVRTEPELDAKLDHLRDIFKAVLKIDVSNFRPIAAAGVDSLSSIRIASKLRDIGYIQVGAADVLEAGSLSELHERLIANDVGKTSDQPASSSLPTAIRTQIVVIPRHFVGLHRQVVERTRLWDCCD